jgi:hypothetical protein
MATGLREVLRNGRQIAYASVNRENGLLLYIVLAFLTLPHSERRLGLERVACNLIRNSAMT